MARVLEFPTRYVAATHLIGTGGGTLLDLGARDRTLEKHVDTTKWKYESADYDGRGHNHQVDLEKPLPMADGSADVVVALDVLEHLENIHGAFREMLRVARHRVVVSLPNMATMEVRLRYLMSGRLGGKYLLLPDHQGDRHRWVTHPDDVEAFLADNGRRSGWKVVEHVAAVCPWTRMESLLVKLPLGRLKHTTLLYALAPAGT